MFRSDFRFVADYFSQRRKNQQYKAPEGELKHIREVMELLSAVTQDTRFMDAYNTRIAEGGQINMETWIDEAENRGISKGISQGEQRLGRLMDVLLRDGKNQEARLAAIDNSKRTELYRQYNIN